MSIAEIINKITDTNMTTEETIERCRTYKQIESKMIKKNPVYDRNRSEQAAKITNRYYRMKSYTERK